MRGAVITTNTL